MGWSWCISDLPSTHRCDSSLGSRPHRVPTPPPAPSKVRWIAISPWRIHQLELFLLHFRSQAHPFIPNLPYWLNGAIITAMESSPQRGLRGHSAEPRLIYWPLTGVWSKQYQSTSMNHVCWKPPLLTMPCNFRVIYGRRLFGTGAMPPNASRGAWWEMAAF